MKRKISLTLAVVLAAGCMPLSAQAAAFRDLQETPWAIPAVTEAVGKKLISGYKDQTFRGKQNVTKAECMTMLYNVLTNTNFFKEMENGNVGGFFGVMDAANIPEWARTGILYGLSTGILDMSDVMDFYENGKAKTITREEVAMLFGRALESKYDTVKQDPYGFLDISLVSDGATPYVNLMGRLGIFTGDMHNNFYPKRPITRAEMAVVLNKTYDLLADKMANQGEITKVVNHGGDYYDLTIHMDNGENLTFSAMSSHVKIYNQDGSQTIPLNYFSVGDRVALVYEGTSLMEIYHLGESGTPQSQYDRSGYATMLKGMVLTMQNENTGEHQNYLLDKECSYYLEGKRVNFEEVQKLLETKQDRYIHVDLVLSERSVEEGKQDMEKNAVNTLYITMTDEYMTSGEVKNITEKQVTFRAKNGATSTMSFAANYEVYLGSKKATIADLIKAAKKNTVYVKVTYDKAEQIKKLVLQEDEFEKTLPKKTVTYVLDELNENRMKVSYGGQNVVYDFDSDNPTSNIAFYKWDATEGEKEWVKSNFNRVRDFYEGHKGKVYCRITFDESNRIAEIYVSENTEPWRETEEDYVEKKGTVASLKDGILKFAMSDTPYKMRKEYSEEKDGKHRINILGVVRSSLVVFERLADNPDVKLYAKVKVDSDGVVQEITEAYPISAKGTLVELELDPVENKPNELFPQRYCHISIETSNGEQLNFLVSRHPATGSEDYTYEDIDSTKYLGANVALEFNDNHVVSKIVVADHENVGPGKRISGVAAEGKDGLRLQGEDKVYAWKGSVDIRSESYDSKYLYRLKELIEDKDVTVYIKAEITEYDTVDKAYVTIKGAKGKLDEYNTDSHSVTLVTPEGNTFSFYTVLSPNINIPDVEDTDGEAVTKQWKGKDITLEFDEDGLVSAISK